MYEVKYVKMSSEKFKSKVSEENQKQVYHGRLFTENELNNLSGICASSDLFIDDSVKTDYEVVYEDGTIEKKMF